MASFKENKITDIRFNEKSDFAEVWTYNSSLKSRLRKFSEKYPDLCRLDESYDDGAVGYIVSKKNMVISFIPPYSEERKNQARENVKRINGDKGTKPPP